MDISQNINTLSFNTSGFNNFKMDFIKSVLLSHCVGIVALQEHWLLEHNLYKLEHCFENYEVFALPAVKSKSQISKGRPAGGIALLIKNEFATYTKRLCCPNSNRVQGLQLTIGGKSIVYINSYFPVDTQQANMNVEPVLECLQDVRYIMDMCGDNVSYILLGDLNADFSRNSVFVDLVKTFLHNNNLVSIWDKFPCDYTYSFSKVQNGINRSYFSVIDHFCVSSDLVDNCIGATPIYSPDNTSNHEPIFLDIKCNEAFMLQNINSDNHFKPSKPLWKHATEQKVRYFVNHLERLLYNIEIPVEALQCVDFHCVHAGHKTSIDIYSAHIMHAISTAVECNIPHSNVDSSRRTPVPGWNDFVKPFREDALFWHSIWVSAGRPQNTVLHQVMRSTRNKYHYSIRTVRKQESAFRKDKMLQDYLSGKVDNILQHIKKSRKGKSGFANNIDGVVGGEGISNHFKNMYEDIFNRHRSSDGVNAVLRDINAKIVPTDITELDKITQVLLKRIILNLDSGKNDECFDWGTDALKFSVDAIAPHFTNLYRAFLVHGHVSELFLYSALIPIVKSAKNSKFTSENYRLIAISSLILKIFDQIMLSLYSSNFGSDNLQFGYQKFHSTSMCTWTLLETANYFVNRGGPVYVCLLDLTKAFDTIKHDLLFEKLSNVIPPVFLRLVIYSYVHQKVYVKWNNVESESFPIRNGVRQGAVASPIFFNLYIDELFSVLKDSGLGCTIDNFYYGFLGYADDGALLAPSRDALQKMLDLCSSYFEAHGIKISVNSIVKKSKTKCLALNVKVTPEYIKLYGKPLPWVDSHPHLGNLITNDSSMDNDLLSKRGEFISKVHSLRQELGDQSPDVFIKLVNIYLVSMYGSNIWDLFGAAAQKLYISWNVMIRTTFNLPFATHRFILQDIINVPHLRVQLLKRFVKFYFHLKNSIKPEVRHLLDLQKHDFRSHFGRNCQYLCRELNLSNFDLINVHDISMPIKTIESESWRVPFLRDLVNIRGHPCQNLTVDEVSDFIHYICCN